jgi:hypothetical protein
MSSVQSFRLTDRFAVLRMEDLLAPRVVVHLVIRQFEEPAVELVHQAGLENPKLWI